MIISTLPAGDEDLTLVDHGGKGNTGYFSQLLTLYGWLTILFACQGVWVGQGLHFYSQQEENDDENT